MTSPRALRKANGRGRRLKAAERESLIYAEAAKLFAERGFDAGTPELAERLGIAQPLLYRYFRTKDELIQKVYSRAHASDAFWDSWVQIFEDPAPSFRDKLIEFYTSYTDVTWSHDFTRMALWANLSRPELNQIYYSGVRARVFPHIVSEMRACFGLGRSARRRPTKLEFELVHTLHGMIYYIAIRRWVHVNPFRDNVRSLIALKVDMFLHGANAILTLPATTGAGLTTSASAKPRNAIRQHLSGN